MSDIFIVHGHTADYDRDRMWIVCAFSDLAEADALKVRLTEWCEQHHLGASAASKQFRDAEELAEADAQQQRLTVWKTAHGEDLDEAAFWQQELLNETTSNTNKPRPEEDPFFQTDHLGTWYSVKSHPFKRP